MMPNRVKGGKRGGATAALIATTAVVFGIVDVEGGFVDHESDPGGKTKWGITEATARAYGYTGLMRNLPQSLAVEIYTKQYIEKPGFGYFVERCEAEPLRTKYNYQTEKMELSFVKPSLGWKLSDVGVNAGPARSARWFQESLNHFNVRGRLFRDIAEDGQIGAQTRAAFEILARRRGLSEACEVLRKGVDVKQGQHYNRLFGKNSKFEDFAWGWYRTRIGEKRNPL